MNHKSVKSTSLVETDPEGSDTIPNQVLKPVEYLQPVAGLEKMRRRMPVFRSPARPLTLPSDLILAGRMGEMIDKQKRVLEPASTLGFNRLHPVWQGSPGNSDG